MLYNNMKTLHLSRWRSANFGINFLNLLGEKTEIRELGVAQEGVRAYSYGGRGSPGWEASHGRVDIMQGQDLS